jgi:ABC-type nitrate/sulfonate/bicarbonate transport system substrate-binding protein
MAIKLVLIVTILLIVSSISVAQTRPTPVRTAYSALSAGIGTLWLTHEEGYFRKHGLESNLIYIRGGSSAVQALLAGEIQVGHRRKIYQSQVLPGETHTPD